MVAVPGDLESKECFLRCDSFAVGARDDRRARGAFRAAFKIFSLWWSSTKAMINLNLISFSFLPTLAAPAGNLPAGQNRHHRKQTGKGNHPELVDNRIAAGNSRCETESQCGH